MANNKRHATPMPMDEQYHVLQFYNQPGSHAEKTNPIQNFDESNRTREFFAKQLSSYSMNINGNQDTNVSYTQHTVMNIHLIIFSIIL